MKHTTVLLAALASLSMASPFLRSDTMQQQLTLKVSHEDTASGLDDDNDSRLVDKGPDFYLSAQGFNLLCRIATLDDTECMNMGRKCIFRDGYHPTELEFNMCLINYLNDLNAF